MFDAQGRIMLLNRALPRDVQVVTRQVVKPGCTLQQLMRAPQGDRPVHGDVEPYCRNIIDETVKQGTAMSQST